MKKSNLWFCLTVLTYTFSQMTTIIINFLFYMFYIFWQNVKLMMSSALVFTLQKCKKVFYDLPKILSMVKLSLELQLVECDRFLYLSYF